MTLLLVVAPGAADAGGSITFVEDAAGIVGPQIQALSGDGSRAAGADLFLTGFVYDASGLIPLPGLPSDGRMLPQDASQDGAVIVGQARNAITWEAFRYEGGVTVPLGTLTPMAASTGNGVSSDGAVVVGESDGVAIRWTAPTGMLALSGAIGSGSVAYDVSGDGATAVGAAFGIPGGAFRWTEAEGMVSLGALPDHEGSTGWAISEDGSTLAGSSFDFESMTGEAFRWSATLGMQPLGRLPGSIFAVATDLSGDGSVVIGDSWSEDAQGTPIRLPFVWTEATGMLPLVAYLAIHGVDASALSMPVLTAVSDDGLTLAGYDEDPSFFRSFVIALDSSAPPPVPLLSGPAAGALCLALGVAARSRLRS